MKPIDFPKQCSVRDALILARTYLSATSNSPELDAKLLLGFIIGYTNEDLFKHYDEKLDDNTIESFKKLLAMRFANKPVSKIIGKKFFWKDEFFTSENVLDPRPDSEVMIEYISKLYNCSDNLNILDLGSGSGCLGLSLLREFENSRCTFVDISAKALECAIYNAKKLDFIERCIFTESFWFDRIEGDFDIIISNPPYIASNEIKNLSNEVKNFDPIISLDGGEDGFVCYKDIIKSLPKHVHRDTLIIFEIGIGQHNFLTKIMKDAGFILKDYIEDLQGIIRCCSYVVKKA